MKTSQYLRNQLSIPQIKCQIIYVHPRLGPTRLSCLHQILKAVFYPTPRVHCVLNSQVNASTDIFIFTCLKLKKNKNKTKKKRATCNLC